MSAAEQPRCAGIFRMALRDSLPVMMGYLTMGFAAGVLLAVQGQVPFPPAWGAVLAATSVSGTLQFLIVKPLAELMPLVAVVLLVLGINFRYAFYGFAFLERWRTVHGWRKFLLVSLLTDETFALESACPLADPKEHLRYCLMLSVLDGAYWVAGVTAGAVAGTALPIPSKGIEFAMVALFLVIFTDQMRAFFTRRKAS